MTSPAATVQDLTLSDDHVYRVEGRIVPGVTEIISNVRSGYRYQVSEWHLQRGAAVHRAVQLAAGGKLDMERWKSDLLAAMEPPLAAAIIGRTKAAMKFLTEHMQADKTMTEIRLHNAPLNYAGTCDALGPDKEGRLLLVDWKSDLNAWVEPQLGFYSLALKIRPQRAAGVQLMDSGEFRVRWGTRRPKRDSAQFDLDHAERVAQAMLTARNFLIKNSLLTIGETP